MTILLYHRKQDHIFCHSKSGYTTARYTATVKGTRYNYFARDYDVHILQLRGLGCSVTVKGIILLSYCKREHISVIGKRIILLYQSIKNYTTLSK